MGVKAEDIGDTDAVKDAKVVDVDEAIHIKKQQKEAVTLKHSKEVKIKAKEKHKKALHALFVRIEAQAEKEVKTGQRNNYAKAHPNSAIAKRLRKAQKLKQQAEVSKSAAKK